MPRLAIDTATETLSIAIGSDTAVFAQASVEAGRSHLELLLPEIHRLLKAASMELADIDGICVGVGPGTFSGLRVGVATARALSQGLKIPLAGSSSLQALALGLTERQAAGGVPLLPVIDARRGQVFAQLFLSGDRGIPKEQSGILCIDPKELGNRIRKVTDGNILCGGNGASAYHQILVEQDNLEPVAADDELNFINAAWHMRLVGTDGYRQPGESPGVLPLYVREPDADKLVMLKKKEPWQ